MPPHQVGCPCHPTAGLSRRAVLRAGAIGLLGLGMNHVAGLRAMASPGGTPASSPRAKSVIYIFLSGGLAQHESFDMKPDAAAEVRGEFRPIPTKTPGLQVCEHLPQLAQRSEKWALVRSLTHRSNDHSLGHHIMLTGRSDAPAGFDPTKPKDSDHPSIAALAGALLPSRNNLPPALVLPEKLVHTTGRVIPGQAAGQLGKRRDPWFVEMSPYHPTSYGAYPQYLFDHPKGGVEDANLKFQAPHLALPEGLDLARLSDRVALRDSLENQTRFYDESASNDPAFDRYRQAALSLLTDEKVRGAFDLAAAEPEWLDRYGRNSFGWSLLMARRLVEAGVALVQVNLGNNETWDTHQSAFPNLKDYLLPPMDKAVSALIDDLEARGLLSETLIVMGSEFGRTPKISTLAGASLPGRDHWGASQTVFFAGGGVRGGNVVGSTDKIGAYPRDNPQKPENLAATIYDALGIPREIRWHDLAGRPMHLYEGEPIRGLC